MNTIVIADDSKPMRDILAKTLACRLDLKIDECDDGRQLVGLVKNKEYDLVITDHLMPEMTGLEAVKTIREFSSVPILVMSGEKVHYEALKYGANKFLQKGFGLKELLKMVGELLV